MEKFTDEQLVELYLSQKDELAFECLVKRYLPLIFGFVRRYTGNEDNASDITQEVFVKVWKNLEQFSPAKSRRATSRGSSSSSFRSWIFTIAKRTAIDWLKKKNALPFSMIENEEGKNFTESLIDESPSILEQLSHKEISKELTGVIAQLPANYAAVIKLRIAGDFNFREIATSLNKPLNTVRSHYRRGTALLKNYFKKIG